MLRLLNHPKRVCHRLDDLETSWKECFKRSCVCHRLDDLEIEPEVFADEFSVCHRLDDLETLKLSLLE